MKRSSWLDAGGVGARSGRVVPGVFVDVDVVDGRVLVEVGESGNVVSVPGSGLFVRGGAVSVQLAEDGSPLGVIEGSGGGASSGESVAVGWGAEAGKSVEELTREVEGRLEDAVGAFDEFVPGVNSKFDELDDRVADAVAEGEAAKAKAQTALDEAFAAQGGVSGALTSIQSLDTRLTADLTVAQSAADAAGVTAGQAKADALDAFNKAVSVEVVAGEAQASADAASVEAVAAKTTADGAVTAAATAQSTATQAKSDATAKSAAAESAAKAYALAQANAAEAAAKAAASTDATTKANAAKAAAIAAAALDAKTKADAAEAAATAIAEAAQSRAEQADNSAGAAQSRADLAKDLADAANLLADLADGKADAAQVTANQAKADAAQAKIDATNKSAAAQAAAEVYAKEKAESEAAAAKADALAQAALDAKTKADAAKAEALAGASADAKTKADAAEAAAKAAAALDAKAKADAAEAAAKVAAALDAKTKADKALADAKVAADAYAVARATAAREAAEATAALDATTKANAAKVAAEAKAALAQAAADKAQSDLDNLQIGGRNLLRDSLNIFLTGTDNWMPNGRSKVDWGSERGKVKIRDETWGNVYGWSHAFITDPLFWEGGSGPYTMSMEVRMVCENPNASMSFRFDRRNPSTYSPRTYLKAGDGQWARISATLDAPATTQNMSLFIFNRDGADWAVGDYFEYRNVKLERGNRATDWTPAPEDVGADIAAVDTKAIAAQSAATAAASSAASAQSKADSAFTDAATAQSTATQAKADAVSKADAAESAAKTYALAQANAAETAAKAAASTDATTKANAAKAAAIAAAALDATTKANAAKAAAEAKAATAQAKADQAFANAATAKSAADSAMASALGAQAKADTADAKASTADGRITIATANPTATDAVGKPLNAVWEVRSGATVLRRFVLTAASTWTQVKAGQDFIGENAIGSAQIADLAVGTAQIADLAVTNGKIGDLAVDKLRVVGGATMPVAVIDSLVSDQAFVDKVVSEGVLVAPGNLMADKSLSNLWTTDGTGATKVVPNATSGRFGGPALAAAFTSADQYAFYYGSSATSMRPHLIPVTVGREPLVVSFWARSVGGVGGSVRVGLQEWTDAYVRSAASIDPDHSVTTEWQQFSTVITPTVTAAWVGAWFRVSAGAGTLHISDVRIERQTGSVLMQDGAVTAPKITASQELSAKVAQFLEVETGKITWNNAAGNNAFIEKLATSEFWAKLATVENLVVTSKMLGSEIEGKVFTGGMIRSAYVEANSLTIGPGINYAYDQSLFGYDFASSVAGWSFSLAATGQSIARVTSPVHGSVGSMRVIGPTSGANWELSSPLFSAVSAEPGDYAAIWVQPTRVGTIRFESLIGDNHFSGATEALEPNVWTKISVPLQPQGSYVGFCIYGLGGLGTLYVGGVQIMRPQTSIGAARFTISDGGAALLTAGGKSIVVEDLIAAALLGPNEIRRVGTVYERSGTLASIPRTPGFTQFGSTFARTIDIVLPFTPPAGWMFRWFTGSSSGYTTVERGGREDQLRIIQVGSNDVNLLSTIGWELVKV